MSMIGLLTGAPQATGSKAKADDTAASGFGSALQDELDALATPPTELAETLAGSAFPAGNPVPASTPTLLVEGSETPAGNSAPASTIPLAPLVETPTGNPLAAGNSLPAATPSPLIESTPAGHAVGSETAPSNSAPSPTPSLLAPPGPTPPVPGDAPASAGGAVGSETPTSSAAPSSAPVPLAPPVETAASNPLPAPKSSATGTAAPGSTIPLAPLVETATSNPAPASANSANRTAVPPSLPTPLAPPVETVTGNSLPAATLPQAQGGGSTPASTPATLAPLVETLTGDAVPASTSSTTTTTTATATATPVAAPVSAPVQASAPVASVAAPAPVPTVPFATQLARPIFSLAAAGAGEHVMTVSVTPDNLGPVTVRAHVGAEGVRVELFAPNDLGRDAIRAIIPDLRRDLAGAGLGGNLTLSSQNQPAADGSAHGSNAGQPGERDAARGNALHDRSGTDENPETTGEQAVDRTGLFGTTSTIDVLA